LGDLLLWAVFFKQSGTFFLEKSCEYILNKKWVGLHFGRFFTNSTGHPGWCAQSFTSNPRLPWQLQISLAQDNDDFNSTKIIFCRKTEATPQQQP
jgi:hypothetical protein